MLLADRFASEESYRTQTFGSGPLRPEDHPLVCQFAANQPADFVAAALEAQALGCDAVDLNLGCPQHRAREHHYGSYLTDPCDWALCCSIIGEAAAHPGMRIPITVKIRLQPTLDATVKFARMLAASGASLVTVHGRQRGREDRRRDGSADLDWVAAVVRALKPLGVPVVTNGNVRCPSDVCANLAFTGAAGIMVAEEILRDPAVFSRSRFELVAGDGESDFLPLPRVKALADEYVQLLEELDQGLLTGRRSDTTMAASAAAADVATATRRLRMEDGSVPGKNGQMVRFGGPAGAREGSREGGGSGGKHVNDEFERMSLWWTNTEVVKGHLKQILGERGQLVSRNTFKRAPTSAAIIDCYKKRFGTSKS